MWGFGFCVEGFRSSGFSSALYGVSELRFSRALLSDFMAQSSLRGP